MNLPQEISDYLDYIVQCIKDTMPVSAVYLFGSYATGNYRENSDLDIYIVTPDRSRRLLDLAVEVDRSIGMPRDMAIDILVNYDEDFEKRSRQFCTLEQEVIKKGVNIYANQ